MPIDRSRLIFQDPILNLDWQLPCPRLRKKLNLLRIWKVNALVFNLGTTAVAKVTESNAQEIASFENSILALQALVNEEVDAVINDAPVNQFVIRSGTIQGICNIEEPLTQEYYGMAMPQNATETLDLLNQGLAIIIEDGIYEEIYRSWFEGEPPELPEAAPLYSPPTVS
ncbi:hypothetical protein C7B61_17210 [filamentous cyanobacterium CCP1]|nr:hypothetical protein C7B76_05000 [filamentous cyanobacterium CCP2]PSB60590.1 hypothetical protein C7B61_17210 [filamentous cyanobacterium CCP1]